MSQTNTHVESEQNGVGEDCPQTTTKMDITIYLAGNYKSFKRATTEYSGFESSKKTKLVTNSDHSPNQTDLSFHDDKQIHKISCKINK